MDVWIEEVQASDLCSNVLCSDILRFADPRLKNTVWANRVNLTKGKLNVFELARSFVSAGALLYRKGAICDISPMVQWDEYINPRRR
jgi:hypothetical protein